MDILDFPAAEICHLIHASSPKSYYVLGVFTILLFWPRSGQNSKMDLLAELVVRIQMQFGLLKKNKRSYKSNKTEV